MLPVSHILKQPDYLTLSESRRGGERPKQEGGKTSPLLSHLLSPLLSHLFSSLISFPSPLSSTFLFSHLSSLHSLLFSSFLSPLSTLLNSPHSSLFPSRLISLFYFLSSYLTIFLSPFSFPLVYPHLIYSHLTFSHSHILSFHLTFRLLPLISQHLISPPPFLLSFFPSFHLCFFLLFSSLISSEPITLAFISPRQVSTSSPLTSPLLINLISHHRIISQRLISPPPFLFPSPLSSEPITLAFISPRQVSTSSPLTSPLLISFPITASTGNCC